MDTCANEILKLFTPKLKWKQSSSILWKTRPGQGTFSRRIHLRDNGKYQVTGNEGTFDELLVKRLLFNTLEEAKQYCNQEALENFLKLCR
jgi:hypothetical protein